MATDEFGCGMYDDICAVLNRANQIRGCKGIIYNQRDFMRMGDLCQSLDIYHIGVRSSQSLNVKSLRVVLNG